MTTDRACRVCGCTQDNACRPNSCWWVEWDLCSECVARPADARLRCNFCEEAVQPSQSLCCNDCRDALGRFAPPRRDMLLPLKGVVVTFPSRAKE